MSWEYKTLGEVGTVARGKSKHRPRNDESLYGGTYPFVQTGDVKHSGLYLTDYSQTYNEKGLAQSKLWPEDTLCITIAANIADTAILGMPACFPDSILGFIPDDEKSDVRFVKYCFDLLQINIQKMSQGSTQDNLSLDKLDKIQFSFPQIAEQKKIAAALSALDDKIALNKKMNQKLEAMAKRLYDYWFVQFDFPDENGRPYKTSGGPMTHNPTLNREIPEGWIVVDINNLCDVVDCLHSKKPDYCFENEDSYLLALENITKEGYIDLSEKYYISNHDFKEWTSRICVKENDFLFTNAGRAGDMGMVPEGVSCAIGRNITAVRPKNVNPWYLRCFFKSLYMQEQILNNLDQGSFFMSFNVRSIKKLQVLIPSKKMMDKFTAAIEPQLKQIEKNNSENSRLTALRDKLLPLLMNGQVMVR